MGACKIGQDFKFTFCLRVAYFTSNSFSSSSNSKSNSYTTNQCALCNMIAVSPGVTDSQNVLRKVAAASLISGGAKGGVGIVVEYTVCFTEKYTKNSAHAHKQSIPGLPSFRGWPGVEARV